MSAAAGTARSPRAFTWCSRRTGQGKGAGDGSARGRCRCRGRRRRQRPVPAIPADLAPYTGTYYYAAVNADMTVLVQDGRLAVYDPTDKTTALFRPAGQAGEWLDDHGFVTISFEKDAQGQVAVLKIDTADTFVRGELASAIVEKAIAAEGLEAGLEEIPGAEGGPGRGDVFSARSRSTCWPTAC